MWCFEFGLVVDECFVGEVEDDDVGIVGCEEVVFFGGDFDLVVFLGVGMDEDF